LIEAEIEPQSDSDLTLSAPHTFMSRYTSLVMSSKVIHILCYKTTANKFSTKTKRKYNLPVVTS
jgi:hypothetical protein